MSASFELEITACAGGKGHVTTTARVETAAELASLCEAVSQAIEAWQDKRESAAATRILVARGRGETLEDALGEAWLTLGIEPDDDRATWVESWESGACEIVLVVPPADDLSYQQYLAECAKSCRCQGPDVPCAGVTAGGVCDEASEGWDHHYDDEVSDV